MRGHVGVSRAVVVAPLITALLAAGCGGSNAARVHLTASFVRAVTLRSQPRIVHGRRMVSYGRYGYPPGTRVASAQLSARVFADTRHGFALFASPAGATFPAITIDAGRIWRIAGPVFHAPAAQGPEAVDQVGAAGVGRYVAYGVGSVVDATTDGGKHWWQAALGDEVPAVATTGRQLTAFAQTQTQTARDPLRAVVWQYRSNDGGRTWKADDRLAPP